MEEEGMEEEGMEKEGMEEEGMKEEGMEDKKTTGEEKEENKEEIEYLCGKESDRSKANNAGK